MEDGEENSMRSGFRIIVDQMEPLLQALQNSQPLTVDEGLRNFPRKGIYAFYENGRAIHVGRANRMPSRGTLQG